MERNRQIVETAPASHARLIGVFYLCVIVVGVFAQGFVGGRVIVPGDATATATRLLASETLWRASVSAQLAYLVLAVIINVLLYRLFRPVDRTIAQLGLAFNLVSIPIEVVARFMQLVPLVLLGRGTWQQAFPPEQLHGLAYAFLRLHDLGFGLALIFFGGVCLAWGHLVRRSGFLPAWIGGLLQLAGACYLVNSFTLLLAPTLASRLFPAILLPAFVAESAFCLWLLFRGVDRERWLGLARDRAGAFAS